MYAKPEYHPLCGIEWRCEVIVGEGEPIGKTRSIKVFRTDKASKTLDPEMGKCRNIRQVFNAQGVLGNKFTNQRRICIGRLRGKIPYFESGTEIQVFKEFPFKSQPVPGEKQWNFNRSCPICLLQGCIQVPEPFPG